MAAVTGKRKPPTPPKPPLGRSACTNLVENTGDPSKERCASSVQGGKKANDDHVYDEIDGTCNEAFVTLKTKTDEALDIISGVAARGRTHCVHVIKSSSDRLLPKPPLLPKPQTSPKVLANSPKLSSSSTRPLVPRRPEPVPSTGRDGRDAPTPPAVRSAKERLPVISTATNASHVENASQLTRSIASRRLPLHTKAPVAKLEEFESFCDTVKSESPVRPPRSPKHQPFKGGPFAVFEEKPELPPKKKQCDRHAAGTLPPSGARFESLQLHWQTTKERSASLGRTNAFRFIEAKAKSASLGRNRLVDFASYLADEERLSSSEARAAPTPPPRLRKKQCGHSHSVPVYAEVNYSLKKNRRQAVEKPNKYGEECAKCADEEEVEEQMTVIEGKLVLPGHDSTVSKVEGMMVEDYKETGENSQGNVVVCQKIETNEEEVIKEGNIDIVPKCGLQDRKTSATMNSGHSINGCVISQDKVLNATDLDFIKADNNNYISHQTCSVDNRTSDTSDTILPVVEIEVKSHARETLSSLPACLECDSAEAHQDSTSGKVEWQLAELSLREIARDDAEGLVVEGNDSESYCVIRARSEKLPENEVAVVTNNESVDNAKNNTDVSVNNIVDNVEVSCTDLVIVKNSEVTSQVEAEVTQNSESTNREYRLSTSSLPTRRKLEMKELGKLHRRRQSWSDSKDDTPSPEKTPRRLPNAHKHKSKSHSWWCDEGELSSGALGDLDSSDATARQSSFEEVDCAGSDVEDGPNPLRNKLSSWFGSFGKGRRKHKTRRDSNSQFYYDNHENCDKKVSEENLEKEQIPVVEVTNSPAADVQEIEADGSRPPSGLSALSALDIDQKSDAPVSEESFEIYQHSESENEAETNLEDGDATRSQSEETRQEKKAFYIAQELMTSERVFIDVLKLLSVDFRHAVHAVATEQKYPVIPDAELGKILNSLPQLQSLNEDLLRDLEHRIDNWNSVKKIADVIVRKGPFLKLYTSYIQNFESQCNYLEECCQKYPRFAKVLREFEASPRCQKLSLKHYMLKPVQRIPQYRLLLEDYLHHLSPSSPDLEDTHTALKIVCDVADHANRSITLGDHLSKLLQLQSQLGNYEIIKPGRMFLKDGELFKLSRKGMQPRYFILLNDCLLYTSYYGSVQSSGLKVNYELPLSSMKVSIPQAEDYRNEFSIISVKRSFTLSARSLSERQEWADALQKAITDYTSRQLSFQNMKIDLSSKNEDSSEPFKLGQEAPVWIQDRRVTMCQSCTSEFTVTFRRHHCRACGKVVCGDCSDFRAPLQYMRFQSARVCEECHDTLLKEARDPTSKLNQAMKHELGSTVRITDTFKKLGPASGKKVKKYIPQRLKEVMANDTGSQMSGWLQRRSRRSWKRLWFVLKEQVLYVYKASEDVVALESIPVLGYAVEPMKERHFQLYEGIDAKLVFQLAHPGQHPLIFHADNEHLANRWIAAMSEATVLK